MTETEWLSSDDPEQMLGFLQVNGRATPKILRQFAIGCCERVWSTVHDPLLRQVIEVAKRMVDDSADEDEIELASEYALDAWGNACVPEKAHTRWIAEASGFVCLTHEDPWVAAVQTARSAAAFWPDEGWRLAVETDSDPWSVIPEPSAGSPARRERQSQATLLRHLIGGTL